MGVVLEVLSLAVGIFCVFAAILVPGMSRSGKGPLVQILGDLLNITIDETYSVIDLTEDIVSGGGANNFMQKDFITFLMAGPSVLMILWAVSFFRRQGQLILYVEMPVLTETVLPWGIMNYLDQLDMKCNFDFAPGGLQINVQFTDYWYALFPFAAVFLQVTTYVHTTLLKKEFGRKALTKGYDLDIDELMDPNVDN